MKLSGYILIIIMVASLFLMMGSIVNDMNTWYPAVTVDTSWNNSYSSYATEINKSMYGLQTSLEKIGDANGWFSAVVSGITAIPKAITTIPKVIFQSMGFGINILSDTAQEIGIPPVIVAMGIISLIVIIMFAIVSFWQRYNS